MLPHLRLAATLTLLLTTPGFSLQGVRYQVQEVQPPGAQIFSEVTALSKSGWICGDTYSNYPTSAVGFTHDGSQWGSLQPLSLAFFSSPLRVFDNGRTIGFSGIDFFEARAAVWDASGTPLELRRLPGDGFSVAIGGNGHGQIVGLSSSNLSVFDRPVMWDHGVLSQLPLPANKAFGRMDSINNQGVMVGSAWNSGADQEGYVLEDGQITPIGTLPFGQVSLLLDVNDAGVAVGAASNSAGLIDAIIWKDNVMTPLPVLPGDEVALLLRINREGVAVGVSQTQTSARGVIASGTQLLDLNTMLDPATSSGWYIIAVQSINNLGQIGGIGANPVGDIVGCVLTPVAPSESATATALPASRPQDLPQVMRERMRMLYRLTL